MDRSIQIKAMSSEVRMTILQLLADPQQRFGHQWSADPVAFGVCMTMIAEEIAVAQPTASRHLDILRQAGFITVQKHQKWSYCRRDELAIKDYLTWLGKELAPKSTTIKQ
ncbi:ArsR/SmtB family transcription factor [Sulfitobacter mediterraneus]|jgi:DNA-binding transcriptional ArsR family regulator|uniref:ArsR/SmtB family transcription factor n=2 Tax=Sulfitobacter mediterraneus TaxID=83219 RepID=UPI000EA20DE6|nr:helix-turn-helix domain-containing protein [Sulfitobacter mediterraneus]